jgi:hypothetical protein
MKRILVLGILVLFLASGCISTTFSAKGAPGALMNLWEDIRTVGKLQKTPGGFVRRNADPGLGALINEDEAEKKDVDVYVERRLPSGRIEWTLYQGPANVWTPEGWMSVQGLESIHMESPFMQRVTLRCRVDGKIQEIGFDTSGRKRRSGNRYERANILLIRLPLNNYRLEVYSYTGSWVFQRAKRQYARYIHINDEPTDELVGNTWVGWKEVL